MPAIPWMNFSEIDPQREYLVMASRLPLRSYLRIPMFLRLTLAVRRQLARSDGLVGYSLLAQPLSKTFWTLSAWVEGERLGAFARAMPHTDVMERLRPHMGRTTFVTWRVRGEALPVSWKDATGRILAAAAEQPVDAPDRGPGNSAGARDHPAT